jgi:hypothetical protein
MERGAAACSVNNVRRKARRACPRIHVTLIFGPVCKWHAAASKFGKAW